MTRNASYSGSSEAAALGGVGPRRARRPQAHGGWPPGHSCVVTRDRARALVVPGGRPAVLLTVTRDRASALAGGRGRTGGTPPRQPPPVSPSRPPRSATG